MNDMNPRYSNSGWPKDWLPYYNASGTPCDISVGPCCCGATHQPNEFVYKIENNTGKLYRRGELVAQKKL